MARRVKTRKHNKTILLVVEGETEQIYFSQMKSYERLAGITVVPKLAKRSSPIHIMKEAIKANDDAIYDYIWCVFDRDSITATKPTNFDEVYEQAKAKGIHFAESLPCFEVWFLMHYVLPSKYYTSSISVENALCHHLKGYCKETQWLRKTDIYGILKQYQPVAINNARKIDATNIETPDPDATFSKVYALIESILEKN